MPVKCSFNKSMRDILPTIGKGEIQLTNQGGLEFLNRNLGAHISATATESACLDATVPISDMVGFVQARLDASSLETGVSAGDEPIQQQSQDQEDLKLAKYEQKLADYETLPKILSEEDIKLVDKLSNEISETFNNMGEVEKAKSIAIAYHMHKEYEKNPDKVPKVQLAMIGLTPLGMGAVGWVAVAYVAGGIALDVAKVLLEPDEAIEYNQLYEKRKLGQEKGKQIQGKGLPDLKSPNIDPDDFEPEDEKKVNKCEKAESSVWKRLENYKVIEGKQTRTNGLSGKDCRYYQWDDWHKEIELYDHHGKPLDALDPVTGRQLGKDVARHRDLNIK